MEACEVVRFFVNKAVFSTEPKRRGNPGYGRLKALRVLFCARLKGLQNGTRIVEHLKKHVQDARALGLSSIPDRTTIGRLWRRYLSILKEAFARVADMLQLIAPASLLIPGSTPLEGLYGMEAKWGCTSEGHFRGFKLHAVVNQQGLPLKL